MRQIINISLPPTLANLVNTAVNSGKYSSKSEFFRSLLRNWEEEQALKNIKLSEKQIRQGKGILLRSLKELR